MQLIYMPDASLPRLAWCAVLDANHTAVVHHGSWIEVEDSAFVEGAWSGPYDGMAFPSAHTFTGSGGVLVANGVVFATATHNIEPIYVLRAGGRLHCSNSLCHLLTSAHDDLDPTCLSYDVEMSWLGSGTQACPSRIRTRRGNWIHLHRYCNLRVDEHLAVTVLPKTRRGAFQGYADYRAFLCEQVLRTIENSADRRRTIRYVPLSTISSGYDSAATSVIARAAGCRECVTFSTSWDGSPDSGQQIGNLLGLDVHEYDPDGYRLRDDLPEAEFTATGGGGGSVIMTGMAERLAGTLLLTGHYGGDAWDRALKGGVDMSSADAAGADLIYFRSRVGFLHLAVPSIGYGEFVSLQEIANSEEMSPWSLGRDYYDRPVPRRIVEEAGVPRELFGQQKKYAARSLKYCNAGTTDEPDLKRTLAPCSYRHFSEWSKPRRLYSGHRDRWTFAVMHNFHRFNMRVVGSPRIRRWAERLRMPLPNKPWSRTPIRFRKPRVPNRMLLHWGMEQIRPRYSPPVSSR